MSCLIIEADLSRADHQHDVQALTEAYALDDMGNGAPLPPDVREQLIPGLKEHPTTIIFLAYLEDRAVGIATCFRGFSTFTARPLINIHDLAVLPEYRGRGVGRALINAVADKARALDCGRVTLEVREDNDRARRLYESAGFAHSVCGKTTGGSLFYVRPL